MKKDLTTGTGQDNIWCPIVILALHFWCLRSTPTRQMDGWQPPEQVGILFGVVEGVYGFWSTPLFRQCTLPQHCILRAVHTLNTPQNYTRLLGGLSPIHLMHRCGAQGLMWGTRGQFLPVGAMVCYGFFGQCWLLDANIRLTYCRNSKNYLWTYFFIPTSWGFRQT